MIENRFLKEKNPAKICFKIALSAFSKHQNFEKKPETNKKCAKQNFTVNNKHIYVTTVKRCKIEHVCAEKLTEL